jgi:hypothetical protein
MNQRPRPGITPDMRIVPVLPLLLAGLVLPATPAAAAPATCFGLTPTIVGTPGESLTGTPGPDVVVTNGARSVDTLAGADSVCVTGRTFTVKSGPDDDRVDWTSPRHGGSVDLGGGSDSFVSSAGSSFVDSGDRDDARAGVALGVDTITTGSGRDTVITGHAGAAGGPTATRSGSAAARTRRWCAAPSPAFSTARPDRT